MRSAADPSAIQLLAEICQPRLKNALLVFKEGFFAGVTFFNFKEDLKDGMFPDLDPIL